MKIIKTNRYLKLSSDLIENPPVSESPMGILNNIFLDNNESKNDVKRKWKKKKKKVMINPQTNDAKTNVTRNDFSR